MKAIHANKKDVYDICWFKDSLHFATASTDNSAALWTMTSPQPLSTFHDHLHFVQGVAWDPLGNFVVTQSSDRTANSLIDISTSLQIIIGDSSL